MIILVLFLMLYLIDYTNLLEQLKKILNKLPRYSLDQPKDPILAKNLSELIIAAENLAKAEGSNYTSSEHFLKALYKRYSK